MEFYLQHIEGPLMLDNYPVDILVEDYNIVEVNKYHIFPSCYAKKLTVTGTFVQCEYFRSFEFTRELVEKLEAKYSECRDMSVVETKVSHLCHKGIVCEFQVVLLCEFEKGYGIPCF